MGYRRVLARDWKKHYPPKLGCPDTDHSPKSEQNRNNVCKHELNTLGISGQRAFKEKKKKLEALPSSSILSSSGAGCTKK